MTYCVFLRNNLTVGALDWHSRIEVAFASSPDIYSILCFTWYQATLKFDVQNCTTFLFSRHSWVKGGCFDFQDIHWSHECCHS